MYIGCINVTCAIRYLAPADGQRFTADTMSRQSIDADRLTENRLAGEQHQQLKPRLKVVGLCPDSQRPARLKAWPWPRRRWRE